MSQPFIGIDRSCVQLGAVDACWLTMVVVTGSSSVSNVGSADDTEEAAVV